MQYTSKEVYENVSQQTNDPIVEWKTCAVSDTEFPIYQSDLEFYDKISPVFNGVKYQISTPTLCPEERERRRMSFRNERKLYRRKCDSSGKQIISIYSPDKPYKVYDQKVWRSDSWDPLDFWQTIDFTSTFSEQFQKLLTKVPFIALINPKSENSEYCNNSEWHKNCYMEVGGVESEDVFYSYTSLYSQDSCDCFLLTNSSNCYQVIESSNCHNLYYSSNSENCRNSAYLIDCKNCDSCYACVGLANKRYCIFNIQYTEDEYKNRIKSFSYSWRDVYQEILLKNIVASTRIQKSEKCFGNNIKNSKNLAFCFDIVGNDKEYWASDCKYQFITGLGTYICHDCFQSWMNNNFSYEVVSSYLNVSNILFCYGAMDNSRNMMYCLNCYSSQSCFWCIWLRNKQYCIFNKQYAKEEYEKLVPKIIEHMQETGELGEFFDPSLSHFGYNESLAHEYFPLSYQEAVARGYKRQDNNYDPVIPEWAGVLKWDEIPDDISSVSDDILKKIFICEDSWRPFRIIKQELEFYRKHNLPLPRKHPDVRHEERIRIRPKRELHLRKCDHCNVQMLSVYDKVYQWKVYCESCYQKEIYG